ncbi:MULTISPECIES: GFA family protein [Thiomonas]|uniref:GFA family protein n=2 Tax=Thiomonas TaxID=32012 RepID=A0A8I1MX88_THIA3|nr:MULTISPECIES: GFA family protein [Thiomonas]MBN8744642.1 GFA family protein [Thiomonas arsenitoxydans]
MDQVLTGGCLCGAIRYKCQGEPVFSGNCHCRDCQRTSGSAFTPAMFYPEIAVKIEGNPKSYETTADSGNKIWRLFCPSCGSQLFSKLEMLPGMIGLRAGTLDDPSAFHPKLDFYTSSAPTWDFMNPQLPKFERAPKQ